jgi:cytochrome c553
MINPRLLFLAFAVAPYPLLLMAQTPAPKPSFSQDVMPILKAHCTSCHGAEGPAGKLNLASAAGLRKGGVSGKALVPGKPSASILLTRIKGHGGKPRMPIGFAPLSAAQTKVLEDWILAGAPMDEGGKQRHWAYTAPVRPELPVLKNGSWVKNPIDAFVRERLEKEGLKPSPPASKEALLRRVSLDLIGLPPTPAEIDAFLADNSPEAYERVVDRLLASPHYGERQARIWLDLARYADTDGYEKDLRRTAWKYRDWVIDAFNRNLPYDQFTIEQMAGDLIPDAKVEQMVATGFHRNSMFNREGGVDQEEAHFKVVMDRVDTTSTVWLGSTLACARCHDHKYDPFSQKDYFRMAAAFNNAVVIPRGPKEISEEKWFEPEIKVPTKEQAAQHKQVKADVAAAERELGATTPEVQAAFEAWRKAALDKAALTVLRADEVRATSGASFARLEDGSLLVSGENPAQDDYTIKSKFAMRGATALRLDAFADPGLRAKGPGRAENGNFVLTGVEVKLNGKPVALKHVVTDYVQQDYDAQKVITGDVKSGWAVNGATGKPHVLVLHFAEPLPADDGELEVSLQHRSPYAKHALGRFRLSLAVVQSADQAAEPVPAEILDLQAKQTVTDAESAKLWDLFRSSSAYFGPVRKRLALAKGKLQRLEAEIPTALILQDKPMTGALTAHILTRGEFMSKAEKVTVGTPAVLPPMPPGAAGNRLGVAQWLVSKQNPLTARVQVNRMWEACFGRGLVETSEDFGTQGSRPSHPELLDWLATEFMDRNWDMKAIQRLIVTSATYQQSSNVSPALLERDPENFLLARGPRFRMEAEMIRDTALRAANVLDLKVGGPSVFPYQPDGIWDSPYSGERWMPSRDGDRYRRGLYTFWKRTSPYPSFMAFDATSREACTVRRTRTNTPLQALALLNDPATFDAAKALARRMMDEGGASPAERLKFGFRACTGRRPQPAEVARLENLLKTTRQRFDKSPDAAKKLAETPEQAAWTMVANVLLNLDETITKG